MGDLAGGRAVTPDILTVVDDVRLRQLAEQGESLLAAVVREVNSPHLRAVFDFSHFQVQGFELEKSLRTAAPETVFIHVKDGVGVPGCLKDLDGSYRIAPTGPSFHARRPVAVLDRIMVDHDLVIEAAGVHHSERARIASDHLPIWARVRL